MLGCLAKITPLNTSGARVPVYVSSFGKRSDSAVNTLGGFKWEPASTQRPTIGMMVWNGDFTETVEPGRAKLLINLEVLKNTYPSVGSYVWMGARVEIYAGAAGDAWPWPVLFAGLIDDFSGTYPYLTLDAKVDTEPFDANVLTGSYAGTGGAEGGADLKNRLKPFVIGHARNVEPILINAVDNVYQFHGYGPIEAVTTLFERGSDFGSSDGDVLSYAALVATPLSPGHWLTCKAEGMIRLGAPAAGVITGDVRGHRIGSTTPRLTGAIVDVLADIAGVDPALIEDATLDALDTAVPYPINLVVTQQETFADLARRLVLPCNWHSGVSLAGKFFVTKPSLATTPSITLDAQGAAWPQVSRSEEERVSPPYSKTIMGAERNWRVQSADEIAFLDSLSGYLTNTPVSVSADVDGVVASFAGAGGTFVVEKDGVPTVTGVTFTIDSETGVDLTIDAAGVYAPVAMSADQGSAVITATLGDQSVTKGYSITKQKAAAGTKAFALKPNNAVFRYDTTGAIHSGQSLTFNLERQNSTANFIVRLYRINSNGSSTQLDASTYLTGSGTVTHDTPDANSFTQTGTTLTLAGANFVSAVGANQGVLVEVTCDGIVDKSRVIKVQDGAAGYSYAELTIYRRATSQPTTPTGGTYDFTSKTLTPPSGWSAGVPVGTDPVWMSKLTAAVQGATGSSGTLGTWSAAVKAFENGTDGQALDIVYRRATSQPTTPSPSSGVPTSWYADPASVPAGTGVIWSSVGERAVPTANFVWQTAVQLQGQDGVNGLSVAEITVYRRSATAPATPSGGTFNFTTQTLTAPAGWSTAVPAIDGNPLYASRGVASITGATGSATPLWGSPAKVLQDAEAVNAIFLRSASQPSTPAASAGVPTGWADDPPAEDGNPLWTSYGSRLSPASNWTWGLPARVEGPPGISVAEVMIYRRAASAPTTPTGGSFNFTTQVLTAPTGWSTSVPAIDGNPLYVAVGTAAVNGSTGTVTPTWGGATKALQDAEAANAVFKRSASAPATPSASAGVPTGWSDTPPAGADRLYVSYGFRSSPANNWTWSTPAPVEGEEGDPGMAVAEITVYRRAASAPSTPFGGSFNFTTLALTAPTSWSSFIPAMDGNPLYISRGVAATSTPGASALPTWSTPVLALTDAESANAIFRRSATTPSTPSASAGIPTAWSDTPPAGSDRLWVSYGYRTSSAVNWTWRTPVPVEGEQGDPGPTGNPGLSVAEVLIYRRASSAPTTPTGGSFNFGTQALTAPTSWSTSIPVLDGNPLYIAVGVASVAGTSGSATPTWGAPVLALKDAEAVNAVFIRSASQPSTPAASSGVPSGWSDTAPAGSNPLWVSYGYRVSPAANWIWGTPARVEGEQGAAGLNTAAVVLYQRTTTSTPPSLSTTGTATFTFATGGITGQPSGWTAAIPSESFGGFLWATRATASANTATDTIANTEWSTPVLISQFGNAVAQAQIFKRASSLPTLPSATTTYTFSTGVLTGLDNGWTTTIPAADGTPLWTSFATASSPTTTDTIAAAEWSTPVIMAQDGSDGLNTASVFLYRRSTTNSAPSVPTTGSTTYTFATGAVSGQPTGWTAESPTSGGGFLWGIQATAAAVGSTDTIANTEWSAPTLIVHDGLIQQVTTTTNIGSGGGVSISGTTNLYGMVKLNITTGGYKVHVLLEMLSRLRALLGDIAVGDEISGNFALTRGSSALTLNLGLGGTTLASYLASGGTALIPSQRGLATTYNGGWSASTVYGEERNVSYSVVDSPSAGTWTYAFWMGPGNADSIISTDVRQYLKLMEVDTP